MKYLFLFQAAMFLGFACAHVNNIEEFVLRWGIGMVLSGIAAVLHELEKFKNK